MRVGAAFDFHSGNKRCAPRWIQRAGFEWLFRFAMEPRRLWRRYLIGIPVFIYGVLTDLGRRTPPRPEPRPAATPLTVSDVHLAAPRREVGVNAKPRAARPVPVGQPAGQGQALPHSQVYRDAT